MLGSFLRKKNIHVIISQTIDHSGILDMFRILDSDENNYLDKREFSLAFDIFRNQLETDNDYNENMSILDAQKENDLKEAIFKRLAIRRLKKRDRIYFGDFWDAFTSYDNNKKKFGISNVSSSSFDITEINFPIHFIFQFLVSSLNNYFTIIEGNARAITHKRGKLSRTARARAKKEENENDKNNKGKNKGKRIRVESGSTTRTGTTSGQGSASGTAASSVRPEVDRVSSLQIGVITKDPTKRNVLHPGQENDDDNVNINIGNLNRASSTDVINEIDLNTLVHFPLSLKEWNQTINHNLSRLYHFGIGFGYHHQLLPNSNQSVLFSLILAKNAIDELKTSHLGSCSGVASYVPNLAAMVSTEVVLGVNSYNPFNSSYNKSVAINASDNDGATNDDDEKENGENGNGNGESGCDGTKMVKKKHSD